MTPERRRLIPGVVLLFGFVYLVFEFLAAAAWTAPPYDWGRNFISDLGYSGCSTQDPRPCSPRHVLMNIAFVVQGTVFSIGGILVSRLVVLDRRGRAAVTALLVTSGVGTVLVGIFHLSPELTASGLGALHFASAVLSIGAGNLGILLLGVYSLRRPEWLPYGVGMTALGVFGIVSSVVLLTPLGREIGVGLVERLAVYPLNAWTIGTGVGLVVTGLAWRRRARRARAQFAPYSGHGTPERDDPSA